MDPVAFTTKRYANRIISDAKSVRVKVSNAGATDLDPGEVVYVAPYLGVLNDVVEAGQTNKPVALALGPVIIATNKLTAEQEFKAGTAVYWDDTTGLFTETPTAVPAGYVYRDVDAQSTPLAYILLLGPNAPAPAAD